jgi:peptide/nickel transport system substrate-binding protein
MKRSVSFLFAAMLVFASLGALMSPARAQDDRPILVHATNSGDKGTFDPHLASGTQDRTVVDMIFNGLVRFKPGDSSVIEPDLATNVPEPVAESDGTQSWTFTLRNDVMCHASSASEAYTLTANDVVFSLQKAANPDTSGVAGNYAGYTFEAVDDSTVKVTLASPVGPAVFLPNVANYSGGYIICQKAYEALGADGFANEPIGTGPFKFQSYTPQTSTMLVANDDYFRGAPKLGGVEIRYIADNTARELGLQAGELHVINGLPEAQFMDRMNQMDGVIGDVFGVGESIWMNLDVTNEYLQDPRVRQAIILAVSRENHVALAGSPVAEPIYSVVPTGIVSGSLSEEEAEAAGVNYQQDLEQARALLAEAGYPDGFTLTLITSEMANYLTQYTVLQEELAQIGITVELEVVQHAVMHEQIRAGSNAIVIYSAFRPTADTYFTQFFTEGGGNTNFSNLRLDDAVAAARAEIDGEAQIDAWKQINIQILQEFAGFGLMIINQTYVRQDNVDYGHELIAVPQLYPGYNETTTINTD